MHNVFLQTPHIFLGGAPLHLKQWGSTVNLKRKKSIINSVPTWIINDMAHYLIWGITGLWQRGRKLDGSWSFGVDAAWITSAYISWAKASHMLAESWVQCAASRGRCWTIIGTATKIQAMSLCHIYARIEFQIQISVIKKSLNLFLNNEIRVSHFPLVQAYTASTCQPCFVLQSADPCEMHPLGFLIIFRLVQRAWLETWLEDMRRWEVRVFLPSFSVLLVASLATAVHPLELQQSPGHPSCGSQLPESSHHCGFLSLST